MGKKLLGLLGIAILVVCLTFYSAQSQDSYPGAISGTVYSHLIPGTPLSGVTVCAYYYNTDTQFACAVTDSNGRYRIDALPEGLSVRIQVTPADTDTFAINNYPDQFLRQNALAINIPRPTYPYPPPNTIQEITGIDFHLSPSGSISGHINLAGTPVCIELMDGAPVTCTTAGPDGGYTLTGLISGSYILRVERPAGFIEQYYPGTYDRAQAVTVPVTALQVTTEIDFTLPPVGSISGYAYQEGGPIQVSDPALSPYPLPIDPFYTGTLAGTQVCTEPVSGTGLRRCTRTDDQGFYRLEYLAEGDYVVWGDPTLGHTLQYYAASPTRQGATTVHVSPPTENQGSNFTLPYAAAGAPGSVSGTIYDNQDPAQPLPGITICASMDGNEDYMKVCSTSGPSGFYWIGKFQIDINDLVLKYTPSAPGAYVAQSTQRFRVSATEPGVTSIDFHLVPGGSISGQLNLSNEQVCLISDTGGNIVDCTYSNETGDYSFFGLPAQQYLVYVSRPNGAMIFYPDSAEPSGATSIQVLEGQEVVNIDFTLPLLSGISGYVFQEGGPAEAIYPPPSYPPSPPGTLEGVTVCALSISSSGLQQCAVTDGSGAYWINYLPTGDYVVWANSAAEHTGQYYPAAPTSANAMPVRVSPPEYTGDINLILPQVSSTGETGSISGIVNGGVPGLRACAKEPTSNRMIVCAAIGTGGAYQIKYLPAGSYYVSLRGVENADVSYYQNVVEWTSATPVSVQASADTSEINLSYNPDTIVAFTPVGDEISFTPTAGMELTFSSVIVSGHTLFIPLVTEPVELPANFLVNGQPFIIETDAIFDQAQICPTYSDEGLTITQEQQLRLYHYTDGAWLDVTDQGYPDTTNNRICGTVGNFSPFIVARPVQFEIGEIECPIDPTAVNASYACSTPIDGWISGETYQAIWYWGDGTTSQGTVDSTGVQGEHTYQTSDIYTVRLSISFAGGTAAERIHQYAVIYNPEGGFVTGGGWINSPAGAYTANPTLTGKATFGFVSKYLKGAKIPTGDTEFQLKAGALDFKSTAINWLVIAGSKAQLKGVGKINGEGSYGFMLTVVDGQINNTAGSDLFRIKIWDLATEQVIYDNLMGASDSDTPTTTLGGGSIVIHK